MNPKRLKRNGLFGKIPDGAKYVGRPSRYGNPYKVTECRNAAEAVAMFYRDLIDGKLRISVDDVKKDLRGLDLVCHCKLDAPCHADILLRIANGGE